MMNRQGEPLTLRRYNDRKRTTNNLCRYLLNVLDNINFNLITEGELYYFVTKDEAAIRKAHEVSDK